MGGDAQPQILLQLIARSLGHGESPGNVISAARWTLGPDDHAAGFETWRPGLGRRVIVQDPTSGWHAALAARGHVTTVVDNDPGAFGHAHLIEVTEHGTLAGAADPRALVSAAFGC